MTGMQGFSYYYRRLDSCGDDGYLEVVRPLVIPRHEYYSLPPHAPGMEYLVGIYGVIPEEGDFELQIERRFDEVSYPNVRAATPREVLDHVWANPGLASPGGWHGQPGHFYAVLQRWLELLCDEDTHPLVN